MSQAPLFPREDGLSSDSHSSREEESHFKRPEFVLIDDREEKNRQTYFGADSSQQDAFGREEHRASKDPLSLRFICLLGFAMTLFATLSLFQNRALNQSMQSFWKICLHTIIAGFGFILGILSPTLGLGLIALYFSLAGRLVKDDLLRKVIKRSFRHF
jgi:hypothetical protein